MQVTLSNTNAEKTSASKPEDQSSIPGIDMVERTGACKLSPELHVCSDIYTLIHIHNIQWKNYKAKKHRVNYVQKKLVQRSEL